MFERHILLTLVGLLTALVALLWPGKTVSVLLLFGPIIWGLGAANIKAKDPAPGVVTAISGAVTVVYARYMFLPQRDPLLNRLRIASIGYCIAVLPSAFLGTSLSEGLGGYARLISPVVFMFALLRCSGPRGVHAPQLKAIALSTVLMLGIILAAQYAGEGSSSIGGIDRIRAFNLSPQHISLYSVAVVGVLICGALLGKRRYLYVGGLLVLMVCTYLAGFRTAWIGMMVLIGLVMVIAVRSSFAKFIALLTALSLLGASGVIVQSLMRYAHADEAVSTAMLDNITSGRISTGSIILDRYLAGSPEEWLFGIGIFGSHTVTLEEAGTGYPVHSDFLGTLVECGVLGLLAYASLLVLIGQILVRVMRFLPRQHPRRTFAAVGLASFVAFTIMGIPGALYANVFVGWYYYGFIGIILAQIKNVRIKYPEAAVIPHVRHSALNSHSSAAFSTK